MKISKILVCATFCAMSLTACGGGSAIDEAAGPFSVVLPAFTGVAGSYIGTETLIDSLDASINLAEAVSDGNLFAAIPSTATVTYDGITTTQAPNGLYTSGNLTMTADFTNSLVTGSVSDLSLYDTDANGNDVLDLLTGDLTMSNGAINGTNMTADLDGVLVGDETYTVDVLMDGNFVDNGGTSAVLGTANGNVTTQSSGAVAAHTGIFVASQ